MKKIIFLGMLCIFAPISAKIGCYKLDKYSHQNFIHCECNCDPNSKPTCWKCGHYHEAPERQIIVNQNDPSPTKKYTLSAPPSLQEAFKTLVRNYRNNP